MSSINVNVDYTFDTNNFFNTQAKRDALEETLNQLANRIGDDLAAIIPSANNNWDMTFPNPSTGNDITLSNQSIAQDTLRIFVGGRPLSNNTLARGGAGSSYASGGNNFINTVHTRGETGINLDNAINSTDVAPWGGAITFDTNTNWYFGSDPNGLSYNQYDFRSNVAHEFFHVLGFDNRNESFQRLKGDQNFTGIKATNEYQGAGHPPLNTLNTPHWQDNLTTNNQKVAMDATQDLGERNMPTELDFAALDDIGWELLQSGGPDFNNDGNDDILWYNYDSGEIGFWEMNSSGDFNNFVETPRVQNLNWKIVGTGDFNNDGNDDILWRNSHNGNNGFWEMDGNGNSNDFIYISSVNDLNWKIAGTGDFSGDGKDDILWHNENNNQNSIWHLDGNGQVDKITGLPNLGNEWQVGGVGDLNNDSNDDVVLRNTNTGTNGFWSIDNNGNAKNFIEISPVAPNAGQKMVGSGDFNSDGIDDIVWRNTNNGTNSVWEMDGNGNVKNFIEIPTVDNPNWEILVG